MLLKLLWQCQVSLRMLTLDRISYRDLKGSFLVLFDDNQKKKICSLILKENSKVIEIDGNKHQLEDAGIASITKLKKGFSRICFEACLNYLWHATENPYNI